MGSGLTQQQIDFFQTNGYLFPLNAISSTEAATLRSRIEAYEAQSGEEVNKRLKIKAHLAFPWMCELARSPAIVEAVQSLIGSDVLLFGSSAFAKNARDIRFVSWHQDSAYYGLDPHDCVTAWIALSPATSESGCLRVLPGSHRGPDLVHEETYDANNLLARGQSLRGIDDNLAVEMPLEPGQFSLHHERTAHDCFQTARTTGAFANALGRPSGLEASYARCVRGAARTDRARAASRPRGYRQFHAAIGRAPANYSRRRFPHGPDRALGDFRAERAGSRSPK